MSNIKKFVRPFAEKLVSTDILWCLLSKTIIRGGLYLAAIRRVHEANCVVLKNDILNQTLSTRTVIGGPFEGMKYGDTKAMCSALYPKLLGVYENEISIAIKQAISLKPNLIVDVGAADGYYAVGFAFRCPDSRVIAFEQNARARVELENLAKLNQVDGRVDIRGYCNTDDLNEFHDKSGLMIVDCEGFEEELLTEETIQFLINWHFIIETHDGFKPGITKTLRSRFSKTHDVEVIDAIHDYDKLDHIDIPLLNEIPRRNADQLVAEGREHACLRWIVCKPI